MFISLRQVETETLWQQAELARDMTAKFGRKTARMIAGEVGVSAGYVRQLIATAQAFANPASRAQDLSFSHHRLAAMTENPEGWIEETLDHDWSVKELRQEIKDKKDRIDEAEQARRAGERLEQAVNKFNEHFSVTAGRKAVLSWETLSAKGPRRTRLTPAEEATLIVAGAAGPDANPETIADAVTLAEEVFNDG